MHGASVDAELQRNLFDGARSCSEQSYDYLPHLRHRCRRYGRCGLRLAGSIRHFLHKVSLAWPGGAATTAIFASCAWSRLPSPATLLSWRAQWPGSPRMPEAPRPEPATSNAEPGRQHLDPEGHAAGRHDDGGACPASGARRRSGAVAGRIRPPAGRLRGSGEQDPLLDGDAAAWPMHRSHALPAFRVAGRAESRHVGPWCSRIPDAEFADGAHGARDPRTTSVGAQPKRRSQPRRGQFVRHAGPDFPGDLPRRTCAIP